MRAEGHGQPSALGPASDQASERRPGQRGHPNPETRSELHKLLQYKDKQAAEAPRPIQTGKTVFFFPLCPLGIRKNVRTTEK